MSLDDDIKALIRSELPIALAEMFQADRRASPRPAALPATKRSRRKGRRSTLTCPVPGCKNAFSPRYGGYCADHRNTAGYKAWAKSK